MTLELVVGPVRSGKLGVLLGRFAEACAAGLAAAAARAGGVRARRAGARRLPQRGGGAGRRDRDAGHARRARARRLARGRVRGARPRAAATHRAHARRRARPAPGGARLGARATRARVRPRGRRRPPRSRAPPAGTPGWRRPTPPTRPRSRRPGGRVAASSSRAPPSGSSASSRAGTARRSSPTGSTTCRRRSCACWPRSRGAAPCCSRSRTSPAGRCSARSTSPSSGWRDVPSASRSCVRRPTARPRASPRSRAARSRRAARRRRRADGGVRLVEAAGSDGEATAVAAEVCRLLREGLAADDVLVVAPDGYDCDPLAAALERAGVMVALDTSERLTSLPAGHALRSLCRVAWSDGDRDDLFAWLRLAGSSWDASRAHDSEARLRARSIDEAERAERELLAAEPPRPIPELVALRAAASPAAELRTVADAALSRAYGNAPALAETRMGVAARRALAAASAAADELAAALPGADGEDVLAALDAIQVRLGDGLPRGRVRIVRLGVARLAPVRAVVLCGLEAGVLPRREAAEAADSTELRRALTPPGLPGDRPRQEERDRFLFAAALARVDEQLVLVRRASDDDSLELAPSPFWDEVVRVLGDAAPAVVTAPPHALDGHDERERLQALAALARSDRAGRPGARERARRPRGAADRARRGRVGAPDAAARRPGRRPAGGPGDVLGDRARDVPDVLGAVVRRAAAAPARRRAAARPARRGQRDAQRAAALLQRRRLRAARPPAAAGAPAGGLRAARPLDRHRRGDAGARRRRRRLGGAAARAAPQPAHGRAHARPTGSTSSSRGTSRSRCPPGACGWAACRSRVASTASTSASGSPRR